MLLTNFYDWLVLFIQRSILVVTQAGWINCHHKITCTAAIAAL
jgi:hypothetical protein